MGVKHKVLEHAITSIGVEGAWWVEENIGEQFRALQHLYEHIGDIDLSPASSS